MLLAPLQLLQSPTIFRTVEERVSKRYLHIKQLTNDRVIEVSLELSNEQVTNGLTKSFNLRFLQKMIHAFSLNV